MLTTTSSPHAETFIPAAAARVTAPSAANWRHGLPTLYGSLVKLRELRLSDAPSLLSSMSADEVARFISPPPTSIEGFESEEWLQAKATWGARVIH